MDGRYLDCRAPRGDLLAAPAASLLGKTVSEVLPPAAAEVCMAALHTALERGSAGGQQFELPLARGSHWFELSVSRKAVTDGSKPRFIVLSRDITERKEAESHIARLAYFDSLTGLPNRRSFLERVDREIRRAGRRGDQLAVLFMDLDGFKNINDTMGHAAGDLILQAASERLRDGLRPTDLVSRPMLTSLAVAADVDLARLGGDEFTALVLDLESPDDAMAVAQRIGLLMREPFALEGREVTLTTSIGIAVFPQDGPDAATLLKHADTAMYHAKRAGRDNAQLYSASLTEDIVQRMELDGSLRQALEREEFHLVYQPQVDAASGRIRSVEALIRWAHPTRGPVSPLDFIPLAEENGLIERIGAWVLRTACHDAATWRRAGLDLSVSVNLSPLQVGAPGLVPLIADTLREAGLPPSLLELEVTEGVLMENTTATRQALQALRQHGVRIALDDFGTGYSSLAYLTRMPIGNIKVDRCFVGGLLGGGESEAIVRAVLAMAHSLNMRVTAEGVETPEQARMLRRMGCDKLQGFLFSRPVPAADIPALLGRRWTLDEAAPGGREAPASAGAGAREPEAAPQGT
ncbi:MAG: EAL domain-containing protein [Rubrivivax sp.]